MDKTSLNFDLEWICRENEEFDDKLNMLALKAIRKKVDYEIILKEGVSSRSLIKSYNDNLTKILNILKENLSSFQIMTADEVEFAVRRLVVACGIMDVLKHKKHKHLRKKIQ